MEYVIRFGADDGDRFAKLYTAFVVGGNNSQERKSIEVLRREIAILDAFAVVSRVPPSVPIGTEGVREMLAGPQTVTLDQPQYTLVKKYLDAMVAVTSTSGARQMVDLIDWFDRIQPQEPEKSPAKKK